MKKQVLTLLLGILIGAMAFGGYALAADLLDVAPSTQGVAVDGLPATIEAYSINGANYFKARDLAAALDIGMWYNADTRTVMIETDKGYDAAYTGPQAFQPTQPVTTAPAATEPVGDIVYVTPTGERYHLLQDCGGPNSTPISIADIGNRQPCQTCAK